ncbi:chaperonin 10-like protein [Mrakia frigida]|uniref:zinc-binding alcohol dehydrogenase family protein n=1 Tax=Mrakia frigida TaxID=29902 RepID=UPI003FCC0445
MSIPQKMQTLITTTDGKNIDDGSNLNEVLKVQETNIPELQQWEALVEIRYVSLGPADVACLRVQDKNSSPGFDLAGVVVKDKSGKYKEGDRVFGVVYGGLEGTIKNDKIRKQYENNGSFATYAVVHSDMLLRIPENQSFEKAAALPFCTLTAYQALSENFGNWPAQDQKHQPILIVGGSTLVGLSAIQLAHRLGYRVLTITSQNHFDLCKEYGADQCFDFKSNNIERQIRDATQNSLTFAIDAVAQNNSLTAAYKSLGKDGGTIVTLVARDQKEIGQERVEVKLVMRLPTTLWGTEATWHGRDFKPTSNEHSNVKNFLKDFEKWIQEGNYKVLPTKVQGRQGLEGVLEAMEQIRVSRRFSLFSLLFLPSPR